MLYAFDKKNMKKKRQEGNFHKEEVGVTIKPNVDKNKVARISTF